MTTETTSLRPPATIMGAFALWLVSTAMGVITAIVALTQKQALVDALRTSSAKTGKTLTDAQINSSVTIGITFLVVATVVFAALYLWLSFKLKAGRNWARITLTVLAVLHLGTLFVQGAGALSYVDTVIQVVAVVLSFLPASNAYVAARKV